MEKPFGSRGGVLAQVHDICVFNLVSVKVNTRSTTPSRTTTTSPCCDSPPRSILPIVDCRTSLPRAGQPEMRCQIPRQAKMEAKIGFTHPLISIQQAVISGWGTLRFGGNQPMTMQRVKLTMFCDLRFPKCRNIRLSL